MRNIGLAFCLASTCLVASELKDDQSNIEQPKARVSFPLHARDVRDFYSVDNQTIIVTGIGRRQWRVETFGMCWDLDRTIHLGFVTRGAFDTVDRFASIQTREARCPIANVTYLGVKPRKKADKAQPASDSPPEEKAA